MVSENKVFWKTLNGHISSTVIFRLILYLMLYLGAADSTLTCCSGGASDKSESSESSIFLPLTDPDILACSPSEGLDALVGHHTHDI